MPISPNFIKKGPGPSIVFHLQVWRQSWSYNVLHCMLVVKFNLILLTHL